MESQLKITTHTRRVTRCILCALSITVLWGIFFKSLPETYEDKSWDFPAYYAAATALANDQPESLYRKDVKKFTNLPVVSILFKPLASLPYSHAWKVFWWLQLSSYVLTFCALLLLLKRHYGPMTLPQVLVASAIFLSFAPMLRRCLDLGQTTPMMVLLFAVMMLALRERYERVGGLILGFICVIKIPPNLLIVLLALRRRMKIVWPALSVLALAVLASYVFFGSESVSQYFHRVILDNMGNSTAAFNNQSIEGAYMRLFTDRSLVDWIPRPRPASVTFSTMATIAVIIGWLLFRAPGLLLLPWNRSAPDKPADSFELESAIGASCMLLFFPVIWTHYYLFLAVPMVLLPSWWKSRGFDRPLWLIGLFVLGLYMASGFEVMTNDHYAAREHELLFRLAQNVQPLGLLLLIFGLSFPLAWQEDAEDRSRGVV